MRRHECSAAAVEKDVDEAAAVAAVSIQATTASATSKQATADGGEFLAQQTPFASSRQNQQTDDDH